MRFSAFLLPALITFFSASSLVAGPTRYRGTYTVPGAEYLAEVYLEQMAVASGISDPYVPKMRLEVVLCIGGAAQRRRALDLVAIDPLNDLAAFKVVGSPNSRDLELTYTSKWRALDGFFMQGEGISVRPHLAVKRLESDVAECAD